MNSTKMLALLCAGAVTVTITTSANAAERGRPRDPGVNRRQRHQQERIGGGIRSGQLTKDETKKLEGEEKDIRQEERQYKSDGKLTVDERKDLHQDLNAVSKDIYNEKHDAETGPPHPYYQGTKDPGINARQQNQQDRIAQGIRSGELTPRETMKLEEKEARVAALERRLKSDGNLTPEERARLQKELNGLSADIYKQKHDAQQTK